MFTVAWLQARHVTAGWAALAARGARRHAGRPPGARGPAEHLPREHHPALLLAA